MVRLALTHLLTCSSESEIKAAVLWVWGYMSSTTSRPARPHRGWRPSPPQPTDTQERRCDSPGGLPVLGCF